jgi:transposase
MSHDALQREYDRVVADAARLAAASTALQTENAVLRAQLAEAQALIADLRRQLFGVKADRLTPEQEAQVTALQQDLVEATQQPGPMSDEVLADEQRVRQRRRRRPPHGLPVTLETETLTLEPEGTTCPCCGAPMRRIGEEVTEETDLIPARLIRRRIVRPKYACRCGEAGVAIAPLPPRLIP